MNSAGIPPWIRCVDLHPDVLSDEFSEDVFALDLGALADYLTGSEFGSDGNKLPRVPLVYRDPESFFKSSYITAGLRTLLGDVLGRLAGAPGNRVIKLVTPFGGGKSHTLAALLHGAKSREKLDMLPEATELPRPENVRVAVIDGQFFDAQAGKKLPGEAFHARTIWGWIAWALAGPEGYEIVREQDQARVAPGADAIINILKRGPSLILLDELLEYVISAGGITVGQTSLRDETINFLKRLTVAVGNVHNAVLVFSLQSSKRESLEYTTLLRIMEHLTGRKDTRIEPVEGDEILQVIQRRLLRDVRERDTVSHVAEAYKNEFVRMRRANAQDASEEQHAEEEGVVLRERIKASYPFHPNLIDVMRERWAAIPDFQRTRGALRFLASCLRSAHRNRRSGMLLGPGDVPMDDSGVRQAFFKEVGQREDFQACIEHDFVGANSRTRKIDNRLEREVPSGTINLPATRLATTILMHSFGGLRRPDTSENEPLPPGISETELLKSCISPDLDSTTAKACLKELRENCLYLHFDGTLYCFKKDPNITLLIEQEAEAISKNENLIRDRIRDMMEARMIGQRSIVIWPSRSDDIPDDERLFLVAYMPLEFADKTYDEQHSITVSMCENYGKRTRIFRNGLGFAVPLEQQVKALRHAVRYLLAIERIGSKWQEHNLTNSQKRQLNERKATEASAIEHAFLKLYDEIWLPIHENGNTCMETVRIGGAPTQITLDEKRQAKIHQRVIDLLANIRRKVFHTIEPKKIIDLFKLGIDNQGMSTGEIVAGFFSFLEFPRLTSENAVGKAVIHGVKDGRFGYTAKQPHLGDDGRYQLEWDQIYFKVSMNEDEIDLDTGFLMHPDALPMRTAMGETKGNESSTHNPKTTLPNAARTKNDGGKQSPDEKREISFSFAGDRDTLYDMWKIMANLSDISSRVSVTTKATLEEGFNKSELENGVLEPLRELGIISEDEEAEAEASNDA